MFGGVINGGTYFRNFTVSGLGMFSSIYYPSGWTPYFMLINKRSNLIKYYQSITDVSAKVKEFDTEKVTNFKFELERQICRTRDSETQ